MRGVVPGFIHVKCLTYLATLLSLSAVAIQASEVYGEIKIETRMVRKTLPAAVYDLRGMAPHGQRPPPSKGPGGFGRVAVWLEGGSDSAVPTTSTMQQNNRHFEPGLLIVPTGSKVLFPNLDPVFHNIFSLSHTQHFDLGYYAEGRSKEAVFPQSGIVQVYCHVHPEMYGVIVVTPSRWTARPAPDGTFSFTGVPAGKYQVVIWQQSIGLIHKNISVPANGEVGVKFTLPDENGSQ